MTFKKGDRVEWCGEIEWERAGARLGGRVWQLAEETPRRYLGTVTGIPGDGYGIVGVRVAWDCSDLNSEIELRKNIRLISVLDKIVEALDA